MRRAVRARACAAGVTALCALTLGLGAVVAQAGTASAAGTQDVQMPSPDAIWSPDASVVAAGIDGVLEQEDGHSGYQFVSTANRQVTQVSALDLVPRDAMFTQAAAADAFAYSTVTDGVRQIVWVNIANNTTYRMTLQDGYLNPHVADYAAIVSQKLDDGTYQYRIVRPIDSTVSDVVLQLPDGATGDEDPVILAHAGVNIVVGYQQAGHRAFGLVNVVTHAVVPLPAETDASSFTLTGSWLAWYSRQGTEGERLIAPGALGGTTRPGIRPLTPAPGAGEVHSFQIGQNLAWYEGAHGPLHLMPLSGNETARVLLPDVSQALQDSRGYLDVVNLNADGTRTVDDLLVDGSGLVFDLRLRSLAPTHLYGSVQAVGLDRGSARFVNLLQGRSTLLGKDVGVGASPVDGPDLPARDDSGPGRFADGGDEGLARLVTDPATGHDALVTDDDPAPVVLPAAGGRILDVSPQYVLYQAGDGGEQYVVDIVRNKVVRQQSPRAAALDYATLWTATTSPSIVIGTDLRTGTTRTVDLQSGSVPEELQAAGTVLYWKHGDQARAVDLSTGQNYWMPATNVLLGDHFFAYNPPNSTSVQVSEFYDGVVNAVSAFQGSLKATTAADTRGVTWTVDKRTGEIAYADSADVVHVARALPDNTHLSPLGVPDRTAAAAFDAQGGAAHWDAQWWLSKPGDNWRVDLTDENGAAVRSWTGNGARSSVAVSWNGRTSAGALVANGTYRWTLSVSPADSVGGAASVKGNLAVTGATPASSGLFARDTTGTLWQYTGTGKATAPYGARQKIGGGWQAYTALTTPNGQRADGSGDLVARDASGVLWYYQGSGSHLSPLKARVKVGSGWNTYNQLVGARDLTGDGRADMIGRDASGTLWLYRGTGGATAPFGARVQVGGGWNTYGMLVATGDLSGDGRADLVARDASGTLWLYRGTGSATAPFAARAKVGTGWNTYNALM